MAAHPEVAIAGSGGGRGGLTGYLTVRQAADVLNMHFMSVYKLVQTGRLPAVKIGSRWKIDPAELERFVAGGRPARRQWLLVGASPRRAELLRDALTRDAQVRSIGFGALGEALAAHPDVVVIDPIADRHAALAALGVCRRQAEPPFTVLLAPHDDPDLVLAAVQDGLVALAPLTTAGRAAAEIEALLHRR